MKNDEEEKNNHDAELLLNIYKQQSLQAQEALNNEAQTANTATSAPAANLNQPAGSADFMDNITPADIANHPKLLRKIPYINRATFNTTMRRIFSLYTEASIQKDKSAQHDLIV